MMFNNVLNRKKGFLHYKNVILTKCENVRFSKGVNPWVSSKIWKYFWVLKFFEKDLDIMFKYLLNNIKNFLDYKNVILTYSKHDHFSKGGHPRFSSKICKFFWVSFSLKKTDTWCLIMYSIKKGFLDYKNVILT